MNYRLQNTSLQVEVSSCGGELMSVKAKDGTEFVWQGNPTYWKKRAPHLFPIVGRLTNGTYTMDGVPCQMDTHGFFRWREMEVAEQTESALTLRMTSDAETQKQYPRTWEVLLRHWLEGNELHISFEVTNKDTCPLWFGYGGHPGFCVPLTEGLCLEDYHICFEKGSTPTTIRMSDACFVQGDQQPLEGLQEGNLLPLQHSLFDKDAIIMCSTGHSVCLQSSKDAHSVTVNYPQMPYLGIWHTPRSDAPFVCLEPWTTLPSRQDVVEAMETQPDIQCVQPSQTYKNHWWITFA